MRSQPQLIIAHPALTRGHCAPSSCLANRRAWKCLLTLALSLSLVGCGAKPEAAQAPREQAAAEYPAAEHQAAGQSAAQSAAQSAGLQTTEEASSGSLDYDINRAKNNSPKRAERVRRLAPDSLASDPHSVEIPTEYANNEDSAASEFSSPRPLLSQRARFSAGKSVEVFFATDRLPTVELLPNPVRVFAPVAVFALLGAAMFIGFSAARRLQALWLIGCGLSVCLGVIVLHSSIIRYQQYWRLAHNASTQFSTLRDERTRDYPLHVGMATVNLPKHHAPGRMAAPSLLRLEFSEDPAKHIVLRKLHVEGEVGQWFERLKAEVNQEDADEGFVFIHGYNVRFEDAVKRTAQLYTDLNISGPAICYSWPSRGQIASYTADEATVSWSSAHFERLLLDLRERAECSRINIIAHSMGNRALLEAIERLHLRGVQPESDKLIHSLILAAPDVDVDQFHNRFIAPVQNLARQTTIYFSDTDRALQLSAGLHRAPRLGFAHSKIPKAAGIEAIHIGQQSFFALGHSYYGSDVAVIDDMKALLLEGKQAAERPFLTSVARRANGPEYWELDRALHAQRSTQETLR